MSILHRFRSLQSKDTNLSSSNTAPLPIARICRIATAAIAALIVLLGTAPLKSDEPSPKRFADRPAPPQLRRSDNVATELLKVRECLGGGVLKGSDLEERAGNQDEPAEDADCAAGQSDFVRQVLSLDERHEAWATPPHMELPPWADGCGHASLFTIAPVLPAATTFPSITCDTCAGALIAPSTPIIEVFPSDPRILLERNLPATYQQPIPYLHVGAGPTTDAVVDALRAASRQLEEAANLLEQRDEYQRADDYRAWADQIREKARDERARKSSACVPPKTFPAAPPIPLSSIISP